MKVFDGAKNNLRIHYGFFDEVGLFFYWCARQNCLRHAPFDLSSGSKTGQAHLGTWEFLTEGRKVSERNGAPNRIRTCDLRIRSPSLYPSELWAHRVLLTSLFQYGSCLALAILSGIEINNSANNIRSGNIWDK